MKHIGNALQVPNIALNPTLDGIQNAVNSTAKAILQVSAISVHIDQLDIRHGNQCEAELQQEPCLCLGSASAVPCMLKHERCLALLCVQASNRLRCWGMVNGPPTYHDLIARDKEVVKSVLLLTGSIEHIKQQVAEYLANFDKYSFLWTQDLQVGRGL